MTLYRFLRKKKNEKKNEILPVEKMEKSNVVPTNSFKGEDKTIGLPNPKSTAKRLKIRVNKNSPRMTGNTQRNSLRKNIPQNFEEI